jgi:hypothetical protein
MTIGEESAARRRRRDDRQAKAIADEEFRQRVLAIVGPDMTALAQAIVELRSRSVA